MDFGQAYDGLQRSFEQGVGQGNADWVAALYAEEGVLLGPGAEPLVGREAVRAFHRELLGAFNVELNIVRAEVQEAGEKGWGYGSFAMKMTPKKGGAAVDVAGAYLNIVQPRKDGTLEILRHCWNADRSLPQP